VIQDPKKRETLLAKPNLLIL